MGANAPIGYKKALPRGVWPPSARVVIQQVNPKQLGSKSHRRYENYKHSKTIGELLSNGATRGDVHHAHARNYIQVFVKEDDEGRLVAAHARGMGRKKERAAALIAAPADAKAACTKDVENVDAAILFVERAFIARSTARYNMTPENHDEFGIIPYSVFPVPNSTLDGMQVRDLPDLPVTQDLDILKKHALYPMIFAANFEEFKQLEEKEVFEPCTMAGIPRGRKAVP